ncbi:Uncharacterised protein [Actinobacillus equuli]|nr:Uncharacterised protein [Actinobacillus equuli]
MLFKLMVILLSLTDVLILLLPPTTEIFSPNFLLTTFLSSACKPKPFAMVFALLVMF